MTEDFCNILAQAYRFFNGQITNTQISNAQKSAGQAPLLPGIKPKAFLSGLRLLTKYHFLKAISADTCLLMPQGLLYVEENGLAAPEAIQRDQKLRSGLLRVAAATLAGNADYGPTWNKEMVADGYTQEEIDGRHQYLHSLSLL